jgi:hypothetical protein
MKLSISKILGCAPAQKTLGVRYRLELQVLNDRNLH